MVKTLVTLLMIFGLVGCGSLNVKNEAPPNTVAPNDTPQEEELAEDSNDISQPDEAKGSEEISNEKTGDFLTQLKIVEKKMRESGSHYFTFFTSDLYLKASRASIDGNLPLALTLFKYLHQLYPKDLFLEKRLAIALIRLGKISESLPHLQHAYKASEYQDEKTGLLLAGVYSARLEKNNAKKTYKLILKNNPKNEDACLLLSKTFFDEKNTKEAFSILDECESKMKTKGAFDYNKAVMEYALGNKVKAINFFKSSIKKDPENYRSYLELGQIYEEEKDFLKALNVYKLYFEQDPTKGEILNKIVKILFQLDKFKEAVPFLKVLSQIESDNLNLKMKLGMLYVESEKYDEAKAVFLDILREIPNSEKVLYYLGSVYTLTRELEKAVYVFQKIEKESTYYPEVSLQIVKNLSYMAVQKEEYEEAFFDAVKKYSSELPDHSLMIKMMLASYYELKGNFQKAIDIVLDSQNLKGHHEDHDYYLATLYEKNKEWEKSRDVIYQIIKSNPKHAHAWNFLGYSMLEENRDIEKAYSHIKRAMSLDPDDAFIRDSLGWYYYKIGKYDLALKEVLYAHKKIGDDHVIVKHLALIYKALNKNELAKKFYIKAVQTGPNEDEKNELVQTFGDNPKNNFRNPASSSE